MLLGELLCVKQSCMPFLLDTVQSPKNVWPANCNSSFISHISNASDKRSLGSIQEFWTFAVGFLLFLNTYRFLNFNKNLQAFFCHIIQKKKPPIFFLHCFLTNLVIYWPSKMLPACSRMWKYDCLHNYTIHTFICRWITIIWYTVLERHMLTKQP